MSLHMSKTGAAKLAEQLAHEFMSRQDTRGWSWTVSSASPNAFNPKCEGRKIATQWTVRVTYSRDGEVLDGGGALHVNIADGYVAFTESF